MFPEIETFFWKYVKSRKLEFKDILSVGQPCKTFSIIDEMIVIIMVEISMLFTCTEKFQILPKFQFLQESVHGDGQDRYWIKKTLMSVALTVSKNGKLIGNFVSLSSKSK